MAEERRLIVPATLDEVTRACAFVVEAAEAAGLDERAIYYCQMAVDEWCTNIVQHGFNNAGAHGRIEIDCRAESDHLLIIINDDSPKFDPTELVEPPMDKPVEEREPGGLGWFLIKKIMDDVQYEYSDGHKRLCMTKHKAPVVSAARTTQVSFPAYELRGEIWVITPSGRLDSARSPMLEMTFGSHLSSSHFNLIVNMADVAYISSSGLKVLMSAFKKARGKGGKIALAALTPRVAEVFHISGFETLFEISATIQIAAATFPRNGTR